MASVITPERIASVIEDAPGWALVACTVPIERLRIDGRLELARHIYASLYRPVDVIEGQLALPL